MSFLEPVALSLLRGRAFAEEVAIDHLQQAGSPLTPIARAQIMRSVVQGLIQRGDAEGFLLVDKYLGFGRVEVVREETQQHYLLKARKAMPLETSRQCQFGFECGPLPGGVAPLQLLLYRLDSTGVFLATVQAQGVRINSHLRFELLSEVYEEGHWPSIAPTLTFDQGAGDDFGDLSEDVHILGERSQ